MQSNRSVDVFRDWQAAREKKFPLLAPESGFKDYDVHRVHNTWVRVDVEFPSIRLFNLFNYLSAYLQAAMFYSVYYIHILMTTFLTIFRRFPNTFRRFPRKNRWGLSQYRLAACGIWCLPILKPSLLLQVSKNESLSILWTVIGNWTILSSKF